MVDMVIDEIHALSVTDGVTKYVHNVENFVEIRTHYKIWNKLTTG